MNRLLAKRLEELEERLGRAEAGSLRAAGLAGIGAGAAGGRLGAAAAMLERPQSGTQVMRAAAMWCWEGVRARVCACVLWLA
jgi:hypothetical protein